MCVEVGEAVEFEPKTFTYWINNKLFTGVKPLAVSPLSGCTKNLSLECGTKIAGCHRNVHILVTYLLVWWGLGLSDQAIKTRQTSVSAKSS